MLYSSSGSAPLRKREIADSSSVAPYQTRLKWLCIVTGHLLDRAALGRFGLFVLSQKELLKTFVVS